MTRVYAVKILKAWQISFKRKVMLLSKKLFSSFQSYFIEPPTLFCKHAPMRPLALKLSIFGCIGFSVLLAENVSLVW